MIVKIGCGSNLGVVSCFEVGTFEIKEMKDAHKIAQKRLKQKGFDIDNCEQSDYSKDSTAIFAYLNEDGTTLAEYSITIISYDNKVQETFYRTCPICNTEHHLLSMETTQRKENKFHVCPKCGNLIPFKNNKMS